MSARQQLPEACTTALGDALQPDLFKALCDPVRISIVANLAARAEAATVSEIADCCGIDFSGVSRHLKILRDASVLLSQRDGRQVLYSLDAGSLAATLRGIADALEMCEQQAAG